MYVSDCGTGFRSGSMRESFTRGLEHDGEDMLLNKILRVTDKGGGIRTHFRNQLLDNYFTLLR